MPLMPIEQANFLERMRQASEERENRAKAEQEMGKAADAFFKAQALSGSDPWGKLGMTESEYYNLAPTHRAAMSKGLILAQHYAEQESQAKLRTKQAEDTANVYRNLPMQRARALGQNAMGNGLEGILGTIAQWGQPNATTPTATDLRQVVAQNPYAGLDPVISRAVMGGMKQADGDWNLRPTDVRDYGNGVMGIPQSPNSQQIVSTADRYGAIQAAKDNAKTTPGFNDPNEAPPAELLPEGYAWAWAGKTWIMKQLRMEDPLQKALRERLSGGATNAPTAKAGAAPATNQTVMRFRKNEKTGKLEQY